MVSALDAALVVEHGVPAALHGEFGEQLPLRGQAPLVGLRLRAMTRT